MRGNDSQNSDNSDLDVLKNRLYKEGETFSKRFERAALYPKETFTEKDWASRIKDPGAAAPKDGNLNIMNKKRKKKTLLVFSFFAFLVLSAGIYFFRKELGFNQNIVSSKNIDISIDGPSVLKAGEANKWYVSITNNNNVSLDLADLIVDFPVGSLSLDNRELSRDRKSVGRLLPRQTMKEEINAFILGDGEEQKEIVFTLEYRPADSNAIFAKTEKKAVKIGQAPVGLSLDLPKEAEAGQNIKLKIEYVSNSVAVLKGLRLKLEFPPGFRYTESSFEPLIGNDTWVIGDLAPNEKRNLEIKGVLEGQDLTELGFRAFVGMENKDKTGIISFGSISGGIVLKRPFINFGFKVQESDTEVVKLGDNVTVTLPWKNNLPVEVRNVVITAKINGAIDRRSISVSKGSYRSQDDTLVWNSSGLPELSSVAPGDEGVARFNFDVLNSLPINTVKDKNFSFTLSGAIIGLKITDSGQMEEVKSSASKEVKIAARLQLAAKALHSSGPAPNSGPLPPRVYQETTYTVLWSISNLNNDVSDVVVRASLPSYVRWMNKVSSSSEDIKYESSSGEVVWRINRLEAGTGILRPAKEVSFQIGFTPAPNQIGSSPELVSQSSLEARDAFTNTVVKDSKQALTSYLQNEAGFDEIKGKVVE